MDRYAVLQRLTDAQNALLGVAAGAIEAASTQPLTYTKNCIQQKVRVSLDPRIMYRGTPASMLADGTLIGAQFWVCGFLQHREGKSPRFDVRGRGRVRVSGWFCEWRAVHGPGADDDPAAAVRRYAAGHLATVVRAKRAIRTLPRVCSSLSAGSLLRCRLSRPVAARRTRLRLVRDVSYCRRRGGQHRVRRAVCCVNAPL